MTKRKRTDASLTPTDDKTGVPVKVKVPDIMLEIIEVTWKSGIDTARNKAKIAAPHWAAGLDAKEEDKPDLQHYPTGSQKPGVYLVKSKKGVDTFEVKIKVTKNSTSETSGKLLGNLSGLYFDGKCDLSVGTHTATMKFKELPNVLTHLEGDASWGLEANLMSSLLPTKTRLELFVIFDKPMTFYTEGVWAEALRFVFKKAAVGASAKAEDAIKKITNYCHTVHGMTYDTMQGASNFGSIPIGGYGFKLLNYIKKQGNDAAIPNKVNCYDQAAAVQALSGALGAKVDWIFMQPYGFIKTTNLVGVGSCNNPFYKSNGTAAIVVKSDPKRTAFGNHAYVYLNTKIHDSCAGPHAGTESLRQYLEAAIDAETSIPVIAKGMKPSEFYDALENLGIPLQGITGLA